MCSTTLMTRAIRALGGTAVPFIPDRRTDGYDLGKTRLTRGIEIEVPLLSAAMDTVTEARMAIALARLGGIGVLHRNLSIEDQAQQVVTVKRSESGMITDPVTVGPDATLAELDALCARYRVSGLPVVHAAGTLVGIITNRDMRFVSPSDYAGRFVRDQMT